jgi:hypothetical protein
VDNFWKSVITLTSIISSRADFLFCPAFSVLLSFLLVDPVIDGFLKGFSMVDVDGFFRGLSLLVLYKINLNKT